MSSPAHESTRRVVFKTTVAAETARLVAKLHRALDVIDSLYWLQRNGGSEALERLLFSELIARLSDAGGELGADEARVFAESLEAIEDGIHDLVQLTVRAPCGREIALTLGKIVPQEGETGGMWCGSLGFLLRSFDRMIAEFDSFVLRGDTWGTGVGPEDLPKVWVVDIIRHAGTACSGQRPISLFFSGAGGGNLSALSNMAVFINHYSARFALISRPLAAALLKDPGGLRALDGAGLASALVLWLRAHDTGHFIGSDSLVETLGELHPAYLALHELKSDVIALVLLGGFLASPRDGVSLDAACLAAVAEMFRYIRRPKGVHYADTVSALLTYLHLAEHGALRFDEGDGRHAFDPARALDCLSELARELIDVFSRGDTEWAERAYARAVSPGPALRLPRSLSGAGAIEAPDYVETSMLVTSDA